MKRVYNFRYELLAFFSLIGFLASIMYWLDNAPKENNIRTFLSAVLVLDGVLLWYSLRKLWRTKWKRKFVASIQVIFNKISKVFSLFLEKWIAFRGGNKNILSGKTVISFDFSHSNVLTSKPKKRLKWKQLQTDRERLRFLYSRMIRNKMDSGVKIKASDTPLEVQSFCEANDLEDELFELYITCRYDERKEIAPQKVKFFKDNLD